MRKKNDALKVIVETCKQPMTSSPEVQGKLFVGTRAFTEFPRGPSASGSAKENCSRVDKDGFAWERGQNNIPQS